MEIDESKIITKEILDELTAMAKENPMLRRNQDMHNSADDQLQRMLNALEPETVRPRHRHEGSSETCVRIHGHSEFEVSGKWDGAVCGEGWGVCSIRA